MEEKKSFFALLDSKSALILGGVGGLLVLCTLGFFIMLGLVFGGKVSLGGSGSAGYNAAIATAQDTAGQPLPPPPTVPKTKKPVVELFVMSYCPYGLQMQKAYLPAWGLLRNEADISVKYVDYAMHGKKEIDENTRQYCVGETHSEEELISYLQCFSGKDDSAACLKEAKISESKVNTCMASADKQFGITAKFDDKASWLSGNYPIYPIHTELAQKYGVQGSPTLIINGVEAQVSRTPEAVKQAICAGFENPPSECDEALPNIGFQSGFGWVSSSGQDAPVDCGV
ncbi:MAG: hypothetical protein A3J93_04425 [Candidatus Magasanikbacteria bacterium RIFOXYC2_FULL_42_28]|uniref:Thioredoxin-like fold domain-containing protein n=1 Tax=Candidatus Magasanikbacteria bacterium RIFOXYC2_FULL_42_28 TaxID=1798704 RepID=A0A1F6NX63_9BACT|nr:MAG: hypothetical protein A3J93_04425 [Candidatus Magasanikbacteria bacterium RIFOXYC2_FULL_42_28]